MPGKRCEPGCTCGRHRGKTYDPSTYYGQHYVVSRDRGRASLNDCIGCGNQAREWAHVHDTDPNDPANYQPMCVRCHRQYDGWGEMISNVKKHYWSTIPVHERNQDPETRRKNAEAQRQRWAKMTPDERAQLSEKISLANKRTKGR